MTPVRLGAVGYLNARPLCHGLDDDPRFSVRFDLPSVCARLLHDDDIDFGLVPSIEFARGRGYAIVPDAAVASDGPVDSVALYSAAPIERAASIALDTSSRTSAALVQILCEGYFGMRPRFEPADPDLDRMLERCDAALLIGDPALFLDHERRGLLKIDLGAAWTAMTGLPFVWAFWAGRLDRGTPGIVDALAGARRRGEQALAEIAAAHDGGDPGRRRVIERYLRNHIRYDLDGRFEAGFRRYIALAATLGLVPPDVEVRFFEPTALSGAGVGA